MDNARRASSKITSFSNYSSNKGSSSHSDNSNKSSSKLMHRYLKSTLLATVIGEAVTIVLLLLFSILMCQIDIPMLISDIMIILSASVGGLFAGFTNGRMIKQKGILAGAACGASLTAVFLLVKVAMFTPIPAGITFIKLILLIIFSCLGGIMGVNKKTKRVKY